MLAHLGYIVGEPRDQAGLVGTRYSATRREDSEKHKVIDVVDLKEQPELRPLCDNIERASSMDDCAGIVNIHDTIFVRDELFLGIFDLPPVATPLARLASPEHFWPAAAKLVSAIRFIHRRELVHGALSPYTVYGTPDGPVLSEFWWMHNAEQLPLASCPSDDVTSLIPVKILPFLSPEELEGEPPSRESDLYAVGSLFYYLLTGKPPRVLSLDDLSDDARKVIGLTPVMPVDEWVPGLDDHIVAVIEKLLVADPSQRMNIFMLEAITLEKTGQLPQEDAIPQS